MGKRLSKIYTRTGDDGTTGLGDGSRVAKDSLRVDAYGTVDEANSAIGVILSFDSVPNDIRKMLTEIQHDMFELGGELCIPGHTAITDDFISRLETELDALNEDLPALKEFILPGGGQAAAACHLARTIVRRAERITTTLAGSESVRPEVLRYLNRLSDPICHRSRAVAGRVWSGSALESGTYLAETSIIAHAESLFARASCSASQTAFAAISKRGVARPISSAGMRKRFL